MGGNQRCKRKGKVESIRVRSEVNGESMNKVRCEVKGDREWTG